MSGDDIRVLYPLFQKENGGSIPTSPLQLKLIEVKAKYACELNALWHSKLPYIHWSNVVRNTHYVCYVAVFNNIIYGVGIFSSPVAQNRMKDGKSVLELRRLAIAPDAPKFTASRMLSIMAKLISKRFPGIKKIISYQDTEVHLGTIYKAAGWGISHKTKNRSWTTSKRKRNKEQSIADKICWQKNQ